MRHAWPLAFITNSDGMAIASKKNKTEQNVIYHDKRQVEPQQLYAVVNRERELHY